MPIVTLDLDEATLQRAKKVAASFNIPLEQYLAQLLNGSTPRALKREDLPPRTKQALGLVRGAPDRPYQEVVEDALVEKYDTE